MKRMILGVLAVAFVTAAATLSARQAATTPSTGLRIQAEERNPWTHLRLNNDVGDFQFAIVSDRTGGHRAKIFSQAVEQLNLLQPEFVLSVGDLIEGGKEDVEKLAKDWQEFNGYIGKLQMPFFYVPGNHDISNLVQEKYWKEKLGRPYYHFVYRNVLFLILDSEDPPRAGGIGAEQVKFVHRVLEENPDVRWTVVALHKPLWTHTNASKDGWIEVEKALGARPYTVFCGHVHRFQKFVRNSRNYYQLATTGGSSKVRGIRYGEFDHLVWVTMKKDGPVLANLLLDGIYSENMTKPESDEPGVARVRKPVYAISGRVTLDGQPVPGALVAFHQPTAADPTKFARVADGLTEDAGTFQLSTYTANDGVPTGEYLVTVTRTKATDDGKPPANLLPARYGKADATPLRISVTGKMNEIALDLTK